MPMSDETKKVTPENVRDTLGTVLGIPSGEANQSGKRVGTDEIVLFHPQTKQKFKVKVTEIMG